MSELNDFLINTGRTLSQMSLYNPDHPAVKGMVHESQRLLSTLLSQSPELTLSMLDKKLLVNGQPQGEVGETALRPFIQLLNNFGLHSLTFESGISEREMIAFFLLAKGDAKKMSTDIATYFSSKDVTHIKPNLAKYARIGEDETIGGGAGGGSGASTEEIATGHELIQRLPELNLNDLLSTLVEKAIPEADGRKKVFGRALELVRQQIDEAIKKAAAEYAAERTRITNERERTESVINSVADGVVVVDEAGKVLMMNPVAEGIYGVKLGECVGKPLWEGVRQEQMIALAKDLSIPTDRPTTKEVQLEADAETKRILRTSSATVQDVTGRVVGMVSVLSDVTKHKELTRLQNEFMANVTHDLRTPMHALKLAMAAILEGAAGPVSQEQNRMLSLANRNVERLARLIDDLLDFSQVESGSMAIKPQVIDAGPLLKDAVASLEAWSKTRSVALVLDLPASLPPIYADSDRILQVVNNLMSNAIKFTPNGGTVTLRAKEIRDRSRQLVQFEVEDTGRGISREDQARIFQRFVQLKNDEKLDVRGTGLGLSICKALVELHKGQLGLQSPPPGKANGSLFAFTIPAVQKSDNQNVGPAAASAPVVAPKKKAGFWSRFFGRSKIVLVLIVACSSLAQARPYSGKVRRVLEGDLIQLENGESIRYLGIDAPDKGSPHFQEAQSANQRLVLRKEVTLRYGVRERSEDGAWLAYVYADGTFVNQELVLEGEALVTPISNEEGVLYDLISAEHEAQAEKRGVWKDAGIDPYSIRAQKKTPFSWRPAVQTSGSPTPTSSPLPSPTEP